MIVVPEIQAAMEGHDPIFRNRDRIPHFVTGVDKTAGNFLTMQAGLSANYLIE
jgi:hypothetical protein